MHKKIVIYLCSLFFVLCSQNISAQFFDTEEEFFAENEEFVDTIHKILPEKKSIFLIDSLVAYSKIFLGVPYRYGGSTQSAFDCSGFVSYVYNNFAVKLPRTATAQYLAHTHIDRANLRKGDLVFFEGRKKNKRIGHVGIVVSDSLENGLFKFIHASVTRGVTISKSSEPYYENRYYSACRIFEIDTLTIPRKKSELQKNIDNQGITEKQKTGENTQDTIFYFVKQGETLYRIAKQFNTTVEKIKQDNNLTTNNLKIRQKLIINP